MNKKIVFAALILGVLLVVPVFAKDKQESQKQLSADEMVTKLTKQLGLSDQQIDEIKPIIADYLAKEKELKLEEKNELSKVLTHDQLYTWDFLQTESKKTKKKVTLF